MKSFHIITFGCQMNEYDSGVMKEMLVKNGFVYTDNPEIADIVIVNGCVVREKPEKKAIETLRYFKEKGKFTVAAGCVAQKDKQNLKDVADVVIGPMEYDILLDVMGKGGIYTDFADYRDRFYKYAQNRKDISFSEYVTIMTGCDNFCSYCVVPFTRGREKSRSIDDILAEVEHLVRMGVKEITLIGQNVNSYFYEGFEFKDLLEKVALIGPPRIRFTTSHPRDISIAVFDVIKRYSNIMPWLHLPLQTGSTRLLKEMKRGYTKEEFVYITRLARKIVPGMTISTDIMVAYPSETEEDFEQTIEVVKEIEFDYAYMFIYSPRKPSSAFYRYKKTLPRDVAVKRHRKLVDTVQEIVIKKRRKMIGKRYTLLIDGHSKKDPNVSRGKTEGNITVVVNKKLPAGTFVDVVITDVKGVTPFGNIIS